MGAEDGAVLVLVRGGAGDGDGAHHVVRGVAAQDAAREGGDGEALVRVRVRVRIRVRVRVRVGARARVRVRVKGSEAMGRPMPAETMPMERAWSRVGVGVRLI